MLLGNYTNIHYQSLIPHQMAPKSGLNHTSTESNETQEEIKRKEFVYIQNGEKICFKTFEEKFECPFCKVKFARSR